MKKQGKTNYKKKAWKLYKEKGFSKEKFTSDWNYRSKIGKSIFAFRNIKYSHLVYESLIQNKQGNVIDEFIGTGKDIKQFRKEYFSSEDGFVSDVMERFSHYREMNANPNNPITIIRENEMGDINYDISNELYDKLIDIYGSPQNIVGYTIEDMFEDFKNNKISYKDLIDNIELLRKTNEEIGQREYRAGKD